MSTIMRSVVLALAISTLVEGFASISNTPSNAVTSLYNSASDNDDDVNSIISRRDALGMAAVSLFGGVATAAMSGVQPASASYSAYTNREKDWQDRTEKGEVEFKSARDLKKQLREIAPMNTESSKIFCPNGPSANVSPLMENKCGDRMATPSVFGRYEDAVGNSIPGFTTSSADKNNQFSFPSY